MSIISQLKKMNPRYQELLLWKEGVNAMLFNGKILPSLEHLAMSTDILVDTTGGKVSHLLNILQCTGWDLKTKNYLAQNVNIVEFGNL